MLVKMSVALIGIVFVLAMTGLGYVVQRYVLRQARPNPDALVVTAMATLILVGYLMWMVMPSDAENFFARYHDRQRAAQEAAYQKRICIERVRLNADLVARGKPPLFPTLTLADCEM